MTTLGNQPTTRNSVASTIPQKPSSGSPERGPEVEHVPGKPEDEWPEQNRARERGERNRDPASDQRADPKDAEDHAEDGIHRPSIRPSEVGPERDLLLVVIETSL